MIDDPEHRVQWLERLYDLNSVIAAQNEPLVGNLFYGHLQEDYVASPPSAMLRAKRDRFRSATRGRRRLLEIGVNGGHSAFLALSENPELEFHGVDICDHSYVLPAVGWVEREFPGRVFFHRGNCLKVLPDLVASGLKCDFFHIDGAKDLYFDDMLNCSRMVRSSDALVVMDDTQMPGVARTWSRCVHLRLAEPKAEYPSMAVSERYRNEVGQLVASSKFKAAALRAYSRALVLVRRIRG